MFNRNSVSFSNVTSSSGYNSTSSGIAEVKNQAMSANTPDLKTIKTPKSAMHFMKLSLEDASSPFLSSNNKFICSSPNFTIKAHGVQKTEESPNFSLNIMNEFLKAELGSLYVPDKIVQNLNAFSMRHTRKSKEFNIAIEILKKENETFRKENIFWKKKYEDNNNHHINMEADLIAKIEALHLAANNSVNVDINHSASHICQPIINQSLPSLLERAFKDNLQSLISFENNSHDNEIIFE